MKIPLSAPDITETEIEAVVAVLRTPRLSLGPVSEQFEAAVATYVSVPHAVAVSSGTAGLHLCMRALGIGEGDEVVVPSCVGIDIRLDINPLSSRLVNQTHEVAHVTPERLIGDLEVDDVDRHSGSSSDGNRFLDRGDNLGPFVSDMGR